MVNVTKSADMKKSLLDNFIFCAVPVIKVNGVFCDITCHKCMAIFLLSSVSLKLTMYLINPRLGLKTLQELPYSC